MSRWASDATSDRIAIGRGPTVDTAQEMQQVAAVEFGGNVEVIILE